MPGAYASFMGPRIAGEKITDMSFLGEGKRGRRKYRRIPERERATGRDDSQSLPSSEKLCKTGDFGLPFFEGSPNPEGPTIKKNQSRSKLSISIEILNLARKFQSRRLDIPTKNRAAVGGSLKIFILARNFQSRSKSRFFLIFGPSGKLFAPLRGIRPYLSKPVLPRGRVFFWLFTPVLM